MNKYLKNYFASFKLKKEYGYTLLIDAGFLGVMILVLFFVGNLIKRKAYLISEGKTTEELQQMLMGMDPAQAQAFLSTIKSFMVTFVIGAIIIAAVAVDQLARSKTLAEQTQ